MKKLLSILLILALLLPVVAATAEVIGGPGYMYVYTANGKTLNVRSSPNSGDNVIGHLKYGARVYVTDFLGQWCAINFNGGTAYVQGRFLQWYELQSKPQPDPAEKEKKGKEAKRARELASERNVDSPFMIQVIATRTTGFINVREQPSSLNRRVESCPDGTTLEVNGETDHWYRVTDPRTGAAGYIYKDYTRVVPQPVQQVAAQTEAQLGKLNVNGEFALQCKLPEGYKLDVLMATGSKIVGGVIPEDASKPSMLLTIAYDEMFSDKERLNDLTAEEVETLKASFTALNEVEFSEMETSHGTKLLVAKETGEDEDFVDFISLYKGYSIEFVLTYPAGGANQTLTDEQIQMCVNFLSDLDFVSAT